MAANSRDLYELPEHLQGMNADELIAELPYEWLPRTRLNIGDALLGEGDEKFSKYMQLKDICIYPPLVAEKLIGMATFSTPALQEAMLDATEAEPRDVFERDVLGLDPADGTMLRSRVTNPGFTRSGLYPAQNMARALHTNPERLKSYLARFAGQTAVLAQTGAYFTQVVDGPEPDHIRVGDTWKLSETGMDLTRYVLNYFLSDNPKYR